MERFDDLMGITHDTGDAFLDKKLNQNTCNIIGTIAAGAVLGALNKPKAPKVAGGGIDPFLKPFMKPALEDLQGLYESGPRVFQGDRVAGFTDPQLAAQTSLLALATAQPDYYKTALGGLQEAIGMQREAAGGVTAEEIAEQRKLLEPMGEAQRLAQQQSFQGALRDIGVGAAGAGEGAVSGARADILRGGAAGELALGMAQIEGDLQRQALAQVEADRARQAAGASGLAQLAGQQLGVSQAGFGEELQRIGLGADVGKEQQVLEQDIINASLQKFEEEDPFAFTQRYLQTVQGTPTRATQIYQPQSTMQSVLGGISAVSGFANKGGGISSLAAGGIFSKEEDDEIKDIESFEKEADKIANKNNSKAEKDAKIKKGLKGLVENKDSLTQGNTFIGQQQGRSEQLSLQQQAREKVRRSLGSYEEGGSIGNYEEGGVLSKIMKGVSQGYQALKNIKFDEETQSLGKYDPFAGMDRSERVRIGLAMMAQMPQLGQGPLSAAAAGAVPVLADIREEQLAEQETARKAKSGCSTNKSFCFGLQYCEE